MKKRNTPETKILPEPSCSENTRKKNKNTGLKTRIDAFAEKLTAFLYMIVICIGILTGLFILIELYHIFIYFHRWLADLLS